MKKLKVIAVNTQDRAEPDDWYRLDEPNEGNRLFQYLLDNAEFDGRETFQLLEVTPEQWAEAEKYGAEQA